MNNISTKLFLISLGIILIILPFMDILKKSFILIGIVPLWLGIFSFFNNTKTIDKTDKTNS